MRKILVLALLVTGILLLMAGPVSANAGPHGGYTATTDACAGCHRAHTATFGNLLTVNPATLCMSCHGSAGTGADTNVEDGLFLSTRSPSTDGTANTTDNAPMLAGGFTNHGAGNPVTTNHDALSGTADNPWGYGAPGTRGAAGAALVDGALYCTHCHDPHGSTNYRIIPTTVNGVAVAVTQVDEFAAKDYDTEQWSGTGMSAFCAACHTAYHVTQAGAGNPATVRVAGTYGGDISTWAHRVDMAFNYGGNVNPDTVGYGGFNLPLADDATVVCSTCHYPHGTAATMSTLAEGPITAAGVNDSNLLRLDNRGVCEVCHQK